eukprot:TRINITY_DN8122_c0_g1_i3.p1 TRINITY_DN8122_c0_g1~~TRINITY_DN8122_c0_g1_i3.p1  ORF type:complete len:720 (+),score=126.44 TRINITY_DN8122_c0_g1_i3:240-2162(+)
MGILFDRMGPRVTCLVASGMLFIGYLFTYMEVSGRFPPNLALLSFFLFIVGQGSHGGFSAAIFANVQNFDTKHRGKVTGLMVGSFAMSSGMFSQIYNYGFSDKGVSAYILMLAILLGCVMFIGSFLIRIIPPDSAGRRDGHELAGLGDEEDHLHNTADSPKLGFVSTSHNITPNIDNDESTISLLPTPPTSPFFNQQLHHSSAPSSPSLSSPSSSVLTRDSGTSVLEDEDVFTLDTHQNLTDLEEGLEPSLEPLEFSDPHSAVGHASSSLSRDTSILGKHHALHALHPLPPHQYNKGEEISGKALLRHPRFWMTFFAFFVGTGAGLTMINNIGSLVLSLGGDHNTTNRLILVFALSNLVGRIGVGFLSDHFAHRFPRSLFLVLSTIVTSLAHYLLAAFPTVLLIPCVVVSGVAYGGVLSMVATLVSLLFGHKNFGTNFGFCSFAPALSGYIYGVVSGRLYDARADALHLCYGPDCFRYSFIITASMCVLGSISGLALAASQARENSSSKSLSSSSPYHHDDSSSPSSSPSSSSLSLLDKIRDRIMRGGRWSRLSGGSVHRGSEGLSHIASYDDYRNGNGDDNDHDDDDFSSHNTRGGGGGGGKGSLGRREFGSMEDIHSVASYPQQSTGSYRSTGHDFSK